MDREKEGDAFFNFIPEHGKIIYRGGTFENFKNCFIYFINDAYIY